LSKIFQQYLVYFKFYIKFNENLKIDGVEDYKKLIEEGIYV